MPRCSQTRCSASSIARSTSLGRRLTNRKERSEIQRLELQKLLELFGRGLRLTDREHAGGVYREGRNIDPQTPFRPSDNPSGCDRGLRAVAGA